jgi:hypothetical protein
MRVCLVQYNPTYPKVGLLDAYNEVVETYMWGFAALGYAVERRINCFDSEALNIVFGYSVPYQLGLLDSFPESTIFFNLEQYAGKSLVDTSVHYLVNKFQIWDYSLGNVATLNALNPKYPVFYAQISYAPILEKVPKGLEQDIDVLCYGDLTAERGATVRRVAATRPDLTGLSAMILCNVWGAQRDEFIARSKVVASVPRGNIFEIVRISYLLANKKAVVCEYRDDLQIESDLSQGIPIVASVQEFRSECQALVENDLERGRYAEQGYEIFRQRDIRQVIKQFFN